MIELERSDEPAWAYLEYQHAHILESMRNIYTTAQERVKGEWQSSRLGSICDKERDEAAARGCDEQPSTSTSGADALKRQLSISQYQVNTISRMFPSCCMSSLTMCFVIASLVDNAWMSVQRLVKQFSDYVARSLPGFWRIAKACMDGKYRKVRTPGLHLQMRLTFRSGTRPAISLSLADLHPHAAPWLSRSSSSTPAPSPTFSLSPSWLSPSPRSEETAKIRPSLRLFLRVRLSSRRASLASGWSKKLRSARRSSWLWTLVAKLGKDFGRCSTRCVGASKRSSQRLGLEVRLQCWIAAYFRLPIAASA